MASVSRLRDPRLAVGVVLVALSGVGGASLIRGPHTVPVYQAHSVVLPGTSISEGDFDIVEIPESVASGYLRADGASAESSVSSVVRQGELLALSSVADSEKRGTRIVVPLMSAVPSSLRVGDRAQLWQVSTDQLGGGEAGATLLGEVLLVSPSVDSSMMVSEITVEIEVSDEDLPAVLTVLGSKDGFVLAGGGR